MTPDLIFYFEWLFLKTENENELFIANCVSVGDMLCLTIP